MNYNIGKKGPVSDVTPVKMHNYMQSSDPLEYLLDIMSVPLKCQSRCQSYCQSHSNDIPT